MITFKTSNFPQLLETVIVISENSSLENKSKKKEKIKTARKNKNKRKRNDALVCRLRVRRLLKSVYDI